MLITINHFRIHTETGNIWTHMIGFFAFLVVTIIFYVKPLCDNCHSEVSKFDVSGTLYPALSHFEPRFLVITYMMLWYLITTLNFRHHYRTSLSSYASLLVQCYVYYVLHSSTRCLAIHNLSPTYFQG